MPTFPLFRLSAYLTLATSYVALGYAEWPFVPEAAVIMGLMVVVLGVLYVVEDHMPLSLSAANRLGGLIGLLAVGWLVSQFVRPASPVMEQLPWSVRMLPYVGPVLAVLLPAKLLRPAKHVGDYWAFHIAALCMVALAAAMAEDFLFIVLVGIYLVCFVWSLLLFFLMRTGGQIAPLPRREASPAEAAPAARPPQRRQTKPPSQRQEFALVFSILAVAGMLALPPFLLTPRSSGPVWDLGRRRVEVGFAADQMLDLTRVGTLRRNPEVAFEVEVQNLATGAPANTLDPEQRWRGMGATYSTYAAGAWRRDEPNFSSLTFRRRMFGLTTGPTKWTPPSFGPGTVRVSFTVPTRLRSFFLVDPIQWDRDASSPIASLDADGTTPWAIGSDGQILAIPPSRQQMLAVRYAQSIKPDPTRERSPPFEPAWKIRLPIDQIIQPFGRFQPQDQLDRLRTNPVEGVQEIADRLLERLASEGKVPPAALTNRDPETRLPREQYHAAIAQAVCNYLRLSGEFTYTLNLRRENLQLDPVEDFLKNTRAGHCERFASSLVLLLRAYGIPTQFVLGFKGCDPIDEGEGRYVVRQEHAHAWVEALVPALGDKTSRYYQWLSLDPTPGAGEQEAATDGTWWQQAVAQGRTFLADYVIGYDGSTRERLMAALVRRLTFTNIVLALAVLFALGSLIRISLRTIRQRRDAKLRETAVWFSQLRDALRPMGLQPQPGQTPREFAASAEATLREQPATAALASVPRDWTDAHYAASFGNQPIPEADSAELARALAALRTAALRVGIRPVA